MSSSERIFVGLGANLGDARSTLIEAARGLGTMAGSELVAMSAHYRSAPVDAQGPDFINAVAELRSALEPPDLLAALLELERAHGRQRPYLNAPRTLDLDLLMYGQRVVQTPELTLPHPRMTCRAFVLRPLLDLAPGLTHPTLGALAPMAAGLAGQRVERLS